MFALYGQGICSLSYRSFPAFFGLPEFSGELTNEKFEACVQDGIDHRPFRIQILAYTSRLRLPSRYCTRNSTSFNYKKRMIEFTKIE
jgi:hypothetical protein